MRNFAILGARTKTMLPPEGVANMVILDDVPVSCGIVETPEPQFDVEKPGSESSVLFRVKAFSLNYRDKNRIFSMVTKGTETGFYVIGSEFVAEVLAWARKSGEHSSWANDQSRQLIHDLEQRQNADGSWTGAYPDSCEDDTLLATAFASG